MKLKGYIIILIILSVIFSLFFRAEGKEDYDVFEVIKAGDIKIRG